MHMDEWDLFHRIEARLVVVVGKLRKAEFMISLLDPLAIAHRFVTVQQASLQATITMNRSEFGKCTKECGGGVQQRSRNVVTKPDNGGEACGPGSDTQVSRSKSQTHDVSFQEIVTLSYQIGL